MILRLRVESFFMSSGQPAEIFKTGQELHCCGRMAFEKSREMATPEKDLLAAEAMN
jgi:hypothetical protein